MRVASSPDGPVSRLEDMAHTETHEHGFDDLAHVVLIIHHQYFGGGEKGIELFVSIPIGGPK